MASRPDRFPYEARVNELVMLYKRAQRDIVGQIRDAILNHNLAVAGQRASQLASVLRALDELGVRTDPLARRLVQDAFSQSAARAAQQVASLAVSLPEIPGAFSGVSVDAVRALEESVLGRLVNARQMIGRSVDDLYARAGRRAALRAVLGADGSPRSAGRNLMRDLMRDPQIRQTVMRGGAGFVDRAGRRWQLGDYADMAVRTVTREAVVQGAIARMAAHGVNVARVSRHNNPCTVCMPWEGRLVSLDGRTAAYEGEGVADLSALPNGGPPFHPRCRHSLAPVASRIEQVRRELEQQAA